MVPQTSSTNINCELVKNADFWATDLLYHNLPVSKILRTSLVAQIVKNLPAMQETLGWIPGSGRFPGEGNGQPLQYPCLDNSMDIEADTATVHGVAKRRIRLCN